MGSVRPFRFGVSLNHAPDRRSWQRQSRLAEAVGFDTLLVADHLVDTLSPLAALLTAAEATDRLRVGTFVMNNDFRHPVLLAREAATLGLLTEGRFELGLGAGHMKFEYDEAGMEFDTPSVRVARLAESVRIIRAMLDGEAVTFTGQHYRLTEHQGWPVLDPDHRVPLLIGGNGRRVLTIASRHADIVGFTGFSQIEGERGVNLSHFSGEGLARQVDLVKERAGDRFDQLELNALIQRVIVTDHRRSAAERLAADWGLLTTDEVLDSPFLLIGTAQQMAEALAERRERFGISYWVTLAERPWADQRIETLAPVIELLASL